MLFSRQISVFVRNCLYFFKAYSLLVKSIEVTNSIRISDEILRVKCFNYLAVPSSGCVRTHESSGCNWCFTSNHESLLHSVWILFKWLIILENKRWGKMFVLLVWELVNTYSVAHTLWCNSFTVDILVLLAMEWWYRLNYINCSSKYPLSFKC